MNIGIKHHISASGREGWTFLGSTLFFLDGLGSALFLPVLPAISGELGIESPAASTAWVGLLVGAYYVGRSGSLVAAQKLRSPSSPQQPQLPLPSVFTVLALSAANYLACGLAIDRREESGLWWLVVLRVVSGALAAALRVLALSCVQSPRAGPSSLHEVAGELGGLVAGLLAAGALFVPGAARPILSLCLAAVVAHAPSLASLLFVLQKQGHCCSVGALFRGGLRVISGGYATVRDVGADREVELMRQPQEGDGSDTRNGGLNAAADAETTEYVNVGIHAIYPTGGEGEVSARDEAELEIPGRYIRGCKGDVVEAARRWRLTVAWRTKERVDEVLREPQPHFDVIKRHYPHYIHRRARNGCPVWIELPGRIDLRAIRASGVSAEALQRHYVFVTEYLWGVIEPDFENGQVVTIFDMQGVGIRDLAGEALGFVKKATSIVQDHYVERSNRMFIVNAPSFFSLIWRVVRPMLNERTQKKITIISSDRKTIAAALLESISPENLPPQYGGTCPVELGESQEEANLCAYVASITPSFEPHQMEEDREVEVALDAEGFEARADRDVPGEGNPGGDNGRTGGGGDEDKSNAPSKRVFSRMRGALGWAGAKLSWRRVPVAHLGENNSYEYDAVQHRWILRGEASGGGSGGGRGRGRRAKTKTKTGAGVEKGHVAVLEGERSGSTGSSSSEEMTVLAIQAAHQSRVGVGTRLAPVPPATSQSPRDMSQDTTRLPERDASRFDSRLKNSFASGDSAEMDRAADLTRAGPGSTEHRLGLWCPCCSQPVERRNSRLNWIGVLYATSTAARESLPVWLFAGVQHGGMGVEPSLIGVVFASGILVAEAGRAAAVPGWHSASLRLGGWGASPEEGYGRVLFIARARVIAVAALGLLYLLSRLLPIFGGPSILVIFGATVVVAANHIVFDLCSSLLMRPSAHVCVGSVGVVEGHEEEKQRATSGASEIAVATGTATARGGSFPRMAFTSGSILAGDVLASSAGPLLLALALSTGWPSPLDSAWWFVLSLGGDLWVLLVSRERGLRHARLPDDDAAGFDQEGRSTVGFAQFV